MPELPEPRSGPPSNQTPPQDDLALRMLYDEQARLRNEIESLRAKSDEKKGGDEAKGGKEGGDSPEGGAKEGGGKEGGEEAKEGESEKKAPLKERSGAWIKEHPMTTVLSLFLLLLLIVGGIYMTHRLNGYVNTDDAFIDGHTDPISARISGIVRAIYVENTTGVRKGQLLVELDPRDNQVAKEQASAQYEQAKAATRAQSPNVPITAIDQSTRVVNQDFNTLNAEANVAASEERARAAIADLHQAEANQANAAREEERYRLLVEREEVSREQYDQRATDERAQAAVVASRREQAAAAQKQVVQAEAQLGMARQQAVQARQDAPRQVAQQREVLAQRQADELAAKAQADQSELNLEYTRIYAPEDGVIGDKQVQVASQIAPGQELFALTQTNDIWITANFKETEITRMHAGQSVTVHVDALNLDFQGWIEALPGASGAVYSLLPPENATGNYVKVVQRLPVRIRLHPGQNGYQRLTPGMSVEPKVWLR